MGRGRNKSGKVWRAKVARVAKRVTLQNQETKCYEFSGTNTVATGNKSQIQLYSNGGVTSASTTAYWDLPLQYIDQSLTVTGRVGNEITLKGMHLRCLLIQDPTNQYPVYFRIIVGYVDPNLTGITIGNLLTDYNSGSANNVINSQIRGPTRPGSVLRKVLVDRVYKVEQSPIGTTGATSINTLGTRMVKFNIPLHNKKYKFISSTSGADGEQEDLSVFMFAWSQGQANTVIVGNVQPTYAIYYKDG